MSTSPIDPVEFQKTARAAWSSVASGWSDWWDVFEQGASNLNRRLIEKSGAKTGDRVLDVATGVGEPAVTAAKVVGPTGSVLACDLSPEMIKFGAQRAEHAGLTNIEFLEVDAHEFELETASFDAAVSRWGLMLMLEPARVITHIFNALRPGATLAASVWADPQTAPFLATPMRVAREVLGLENPPADTPGPFRLAEEGALDKLLSTAGFAEVEHELITVRMSFASQDEYRNFLLELSSTMRRTLDECSPADRDRVWNEIEAAVEPYRGKQGQYDFDNQAWCVWARRP